MDAREIESISMLTRGFSDLKEVNPELLYNMVLDILSGINEYVLFFGAYPRRQLTRLFRPCSNQGIRQHINTTRGLFPHRKITRQSTMTANGLVVVEHEEIPPSGLDPAAESQATLVPPPAEEVRKSPISDLLYMRWLEGLRIKWASIL